MDAISKVINKINRFCILIAATCLGFLAFTVTYEIVARYVFNSPSIWTTEISSYLLQFLAFFSMGYLLIEKKHVRVTFLVDRLKGLNRKLLEIFTVFLTIPYSVILIIYGFRFTENVFRVGAKSPTLLAVPLWIPYSFIMFAGILLALAAISSIITIARTDYGDEKVLEEENATGGELI
ncbi:TRAP transporter small permease subunit [Lysinibacillus sp. BW-2-10]|uniref:TRAP transporter small permease subunit n=1 Tax=Lysinibacillus sp. BW-2-10 TaxID=2590030 RepID=UPI00117F6065|nr:TRAP transporter small permease [Lysinibacillus sp. BW-2-10]TSI09304.1 TRAP transporter small permease [Lysinibacillus sp. BW-2-10]